jgi:hypothetical protein
MTRSTVDAIPSNTEEALEWLDYSNAVLRTPAAILITKADKYPKIVSYHWQKAEQAA